MPGLAAGNLHLRVFDTGPLELGKYLDAGVHVVEGPFFVGGELQICLLAGLPRDDQVVDRAVGIDVPQPLGDLQEPGRVDPSVVAASWYHEIFQNRLGLFEGLWIDGILQLEGDLRGGNLLEDAGVVPDGGFR